jgi:hypothetical protein
VLVQIVSDNGKEIPMTELLPYLKQLLELAAVSPTVAVSILALVLLGYVVFAAGVACKRQNRDAFEVFVRLLILIVLAVLVVVIRT